MTIIRDDRYIENLQNMLDNIAKDSITRANKFRINLDKKINILPNMPFKFRQSNYYDDKNIRDLIFKGYTVPYLVDMEKELIVVLDIFKYSYRKIMK